MNKQGRVSVRLYCKDGYAEGGLVEEAEATRQEGRWGDDILIHVNEEEFEQMKRMWGEPTLNPNTGLPEYGFLSKLWNGIKKVFKTVAPIAINFVPGIGPALSGALSAIGLPSGALATSIAKGALAGGISNGSKGAALGALTGGLGGGAGVASKLGLGQGALQTAFGDALLTGGTSAALGGDFGKGALTGGLASIALPYVNNALAGTKAGQSMGVNVVPILSSPYPLGSPDSLSGVTAQSQQRLPEINDLGDIQEVVVHGSRLNKPVASPSTATMIPWTTSPSTTTNVGANAIPTPDVGAEDPGDESQIQNGSFLDKAFGYAKNHPLDTAVMLAGLSGIGGSAASAPTGPVVVNDANAQPLPQFEFKRDRNDDYRDYYTYGMRPEASFYTNNGPPTRLAEGGLAMKEVGRGRYVNPETYGKSLVEDYRRVTPNHGRAALGLAGLSDLLDFQGEGKQNETLNRMLAQNALRDRTRSDIRSRYDRDVKGNSPSRGNPFKKMAAGGRADTIDAKLSEGEYVMDAETVSLLGDGSVAAGAQKLEQLRRNIRKHKGKALAKGKISPNAKNAEAYLGGVK